MKIKRYLEKDMRHVLRRVREDQGPDAVILSNRRVDDGIEVIAAIDYDAALVRHALGNDVELDQAAETDALARLAEDDGISSEKIADAIVREPEILSANLQPTDPSLHSVRDELSSLRGLLESQLSGLVWKDTNERSPMRAQMLRNLARIGIAPDIANRVVDRLEPVTDVRSLWHAPLSALAQMLPAADDALLAEGGTIALIGPTGVGKTTTIAKIAARFAMRNGEDDIALVSADAYRIGAKEHLMAFANIIGANVYSASSTNELTELLARLAGKRLILIDTEGRSPRDRDLANRLAAFGNNRDRVRFYLTLSASAQEAALDEAITRVRTVPLEGCVVTKTDEASQLGGVISALIRHDLPMSWIADGQRIPDDLHAAARKKLWLINQAIERLEHDQPDIDERMMAERYARASVSNG
ncbi:MAG: flagellar biosynthesis protein FlhF [Pseudomonadota bacterium]